ncbi:MAG: hypothetical protein BA865_11515 [Desulfobacterales bacterium S5133MH4]|jgi:hypothetical protein|nr:MAG: hypothetical protein BA865_11515 [Desulfobacterales bacterium S5133MH4]
MRSLCWFVQEEDAKLIKQTKPEKEGIMSEENPKNATGLKKELEEAVASRDKEKIYQVLQKAFMNVVELKITTTVTEGKLEGKLEGIETTINLLEGDIRTVISKTYAPDSETVAIYHKEQINKAEQIIERNVNTLKSLARGLVELL